MIESGDAIGGDLQIGEFDINSANFSKIFRVYFELNILLRSLMNYNNPISGEAKMGCIEDIISNLISHLDDEFKSNIAKIDEEMKRALVLAKTKTGEDSTGQAENAVNKAAQMKYREIIKLLTRKRILPGQAEHEWL